MLVGVVLVVAVALCSVAMLTGLTWWAYADAETSTVGTLDFEQPLHVPPLLEGSPSADGTTEFPLRLRSGRTELLDGQRTSTWGVNGTYLGPTLRMRRGDRVRMQVDNELPETSSLHWHGMHLPAEMDGGPHQPIEPGATWSPHWTVDQPAATLWYHPHLHGTTAEHVYRGVAGMILVEDDDADQLGLPSTYGVDDVPLILQDKQFDSEGELDTSEPMFSSVGILGDELLVNGTHDPHLDLSHRLVRFRVLNASNARTYDLGFDDQRRFELVATDSGLLAAPEPMQRLVLSPGERAEILVALEPGDRPVLRSFGGASGLDFWSSRFGGHDDSFDVLELRAADRLEQDGSLPERLVDQDLLDPADAVETRRFRLSGTSINGMDMDMDRIDEVATVDTVEVWEIENADGQLHNFHVHDVRFRVLDVAGRPPPTHLQGWKDTVAVSPGSTVRVVLRFSDFADAATPYMFHCHLLAHEDHGMMGQFVVVRPGQPAAGPSGRASHDHGG